VCFDDRASHLHNPDDLQAVRLQDDEALDGVPVDADAGGDDDVSAVVHDAVEPDDVQLEVAELESLRLERCSSPEEN
jgi:predicted DNA-binding protein (UPF0251 family)